MAGYRVGIRPAPARRPVFRRAAKRHEATHPHTLFLGSSDLIANALAGDLAFELGKRQQHVEGQPAHGRGGVELLGALLRAWSSRILPDPKLTVSEWADRRRWLSSRASAELGG